GQRCAIRARDVANAVSDIPGTLIRDHRYFELFARRKIAPADIHVRRARFICVEQATRRIGGEYQRVSPARHRKCEARLRLSHLELPYTWRRWVALHLKSSDREAVALERGLGF